MKKIVILIISLLMALALTACQEDAANVPNNPANDRPPTSQPGNTPSSPTTTPNNPNTSGPLTLSEFESNLPNGFIKLVASQPGRPGYDNGKLRIVLENENNRTVQGMSYSRITTVNISSAIDSRSPKLTISFCNIADYAMTNQGLSAGLVEFLYDVMTNPGDNIETVLGWTPELVVALAETVRGGGSSRLSLDIVGEEMLVGEINFSADSGYGMGLWDDYDREDAHYQFNFRPSAEDESTWMSGWDEGDAVKFSLNVARDMTIVIVQASAGAIPSNN